MQEVAMQLYEVTPNASYLYRLIKHYGVTDSPMLGGFLLPDGMFLDFSEGSRSRSQDHRNITWVSTVPEKPRESRYDVMVRICKRVGMYRWMPESWSIEAWTPPTRGQIETIWALAAYKEILLEAYLGRRHFAEQYATFEADQAVRDFARFFKRG
jgi:hypothetical protein